MRFTNEHTIKFRANEKRRGRKFNYMKSSTFKIFEDPIREQRARELIQAIIDGAKNDYLLREPYEDDEFIADKYAAVDDAIEMAANMHRYGIIDLPKASQDILDRAIARYAQNTKDNGGSVNESDLKLFNKMARCVVYDAEALIAKGETITDDKIAELCQEVWLNFNED